MSAPKPKDGDGDSPPKPKTGSHEIYLPDEDPLIVLDADAPPVPTDPPAGSPPGPKPASRAVRPSSPGTAAIPAIIDDIPSAKSTPAPRAPAEHTTEPPSIANDRVREPVELPFAATARRQETVARRHRGPAARCWSASGCCSPSAPGPGSPALRPNPPVITSIVPSKAEPGQTVTIAGTALGSDADGDGGALRRPPRPGDQRHRTPRSPPPSPRSSPTCPRATSASWSKWTA